VGQAEGVPHRAARETWFVPLCQIITVEADRGGCPVADFLSNAMRTPAEAHATVRCLESVASFVRAASGWTDWQSVRRLGNLPHNGFQGPELPQPIMNAATPV
jgi:hypothetical protein